MNEAGIYGTGERMPRRYSKWVVNEWVSCLRILGIQRENLTSHISRHNRRPSSVDGFLCNLGVELKNLSCKPRSILQVVLKLACRQLCLLLYPKQRASNLELRLKAAAIRNHSHPSLFWGRIIPICAVIEEFRTYSAGGVGRGAAGRGRAGSRSRSGGFSPYA